MECPKCHSYVDENQTICPKCHKVLFLECPNCHNLSDNAVCSKCGYTILVKCAKCGKLTPTNKEKCSKCNFSTLASLAHQECESDEFASIIVRFGSLKNIKRLLKSQELYSKFFFKLKNLLYAQLKGVECKLITYGDVFVINMNKELSFATSSNKAVRLALKIANAFVEVNNNVLEELFVPLNLSLTIIRKASEELQSLTVYESNVKPLTVKKDSKKYLKGLQVILDQYVRDEVSKDYKTDSLYSIEENSKSVMFYEVILNSYVLPPSVEQEEQKIEVSLKDTKKPADEKESKDIYSFKVFDINAKCSFERIPTVNFIEKLDSYDLKKKAKIISIKATENEVLPISELVEFYRKRDFNVLKVSCNEIMQYKPWGVFETLFKEYFNLPFHKNFLDLNRIDENSLKTFKPLFELVLGKPVKAMTSEDARFTYMELWGKFLSILSDTAIIFDGFENIDDTTLQTLELYFDKFKNVKPNFVFITSRELSVHSKLKGLLRTPLYTEFTLQKSSLDTCLSLLKSDATDFIQSFYFEKIKENFNGSYFYFKNAIAYLEEAGVLIDFENRLLLKNKKSIILPKDIKGLLKARIKNLSKDVDVSFIFAYFAMLSPRIDRKIFEALGVKDFDNVLKKISNSSLVDYSKEMLSLNNYNLMQPVVLSLLKKEAETFIAKNILAQVGKGLDEAPLISILGRLGIYKEEYLTLWKNSQLAINMGDYDAYLKNCLGYLSLVEHIDTNTSKKEIEENKKEVYNNILMFLYSYSPAKIYYIENILLMDAIKDGDDEKIVKLSNLMLQGALISSNYTDALGLLHNILSRMSNPVLKIDGLVNTKFLLLSLVKIEILYNIGDFKQCVEIAGEILSVLNPTIIEKIKPASFSTNLFVSHILDTFTLVAFAKLMLLDEDITEFYEKIKQALDTDLPEKDAILAIYDFICGRVYSNGNMEEYSAFSKIIFLILQEISDIKGDYKRFAQNIYQAKILAMEIHQREAELFCDLLIAYAYSKARVHDKAEYIYSDVIKTAEKTAMFNILLLAKYLMAKMKFDLNSSEEALLLVNDALALIRKYDNQAKILYALFEKLYIDIAQKEKMSSVDIESEKLKIEDLKQKLIKILN